MFHHHFFHTHGDRVPRSREDFNRDDIQRERGGFGCGKRGRHAGFGGGPWGRGERGPGMGGGRERLFDGGDLRLIVLQLLAEKPSYGYELIKTMEEKLSGGYAPSPGVIYPTLTLLEEEGLTSSSMDGGKKVFTVTDAGQATLAEHKARLDAINSRVEQAGKVFGRGRSPQIMQAFMSLRSAVKAKASRGGLTKEQIAAIAAAIETAAKTIDNV